MNWYLTALKKYAVLSGRARRSEYWWFMTISMVLMIMLMIVDITLMVSAGIPFAPLMTLYGIAVFIPTITVTVRRLHDIGRSGWWYLITFVPLVGWFTLLIFTLLDSQPGENRYGPYPKDCCDPSRTHCKGAEQPA